jgi:hypothetical protein
MDAGWIRTQRIQRSHPNRASRPLPLDSKRGADRLFLRGRSKEPFTSKAEMAVIVDGDLLRINGQVLEFSTQIMQRG